MNEITVHTNDTEIVIAPTMASYARVADVVVKASVFSRELEGKSKNTRTAYESALVTWGEYISSTGVETQDYYNEPSAWQDVTHGVVTLFVEWMKVKGFSIASINQKLSAVRQFCTLASKAGVIPADELLMIQTVGTIRRGEGLEIDRQREQSRIDRPNAKKAKSIELTPEQAKLLKTQPDSPQGRRDALLMCLLLDHGMRAGEVAVLMLNNFDLKRGVVTFWRDKVEKEQTHKLTADTLTALRNYVDSGDIQPMELLLRSSLKSGELSKGGMSEVAITARVKKLGEAIGVDGLSAHDCRHFWATDATRNGTDPFVLQQAGGWTSMQTVQRYIDISKIANDGVKLSA